MARTLINIQPTAKRGEIIEIRATIGHPMETGFRPGDDGKLLPRNIIQRFSCRYNGELIFSAEMFSAMAANPYISFLPRPFRTHAIRLRVHGAINPDDAERRWAEPGNVVRPRRRGPVAKASWPK